MADTPTPDRIRVAPVDLALFAALPLAKQTRVIAHLAALAADGDEPLTTDQLTLLATALKERSWPREGIIAWLTDHWQKSGLKALTRREAAEAIWWLSQPDDAATADDEFAELPRVLGPDAPVTADQVAALGDLRQATGQTEHAFGAMLQNFWKKDDARHLNQTQYAAAWQRLRARLPASQRDAWPEVAP